MRIPSIILSAALTLAAGAAAAQSLPFAYPSTLLDAPATLTEPPGAFVRFGKPVVVLDQTTLEEAAAFTHAVRLKEGRGDFTRHYSCLTGTEGGRALRVWLVSSDAKHVTEVQLEWVKEESKTPPTCRALPSEKLPVRLGKVGLGMSEADVEALAGEPSYKDGAGWSYWFSQRFLRNARNLQELELNWLAVRFEEGRAAQAFISMVKNP